MENREYKIITPLGYYVVQKNDENGKFIEISFEKKDVPDPEDAPERLPKTWEELNKIEGYYTTKNAEIAHVYGETCDLLKNVFPTREEAEAAIALAQLCQLRDRYNDGWQPDWTDNTIHKHCIYYFNNAIYIEECLKVKRVLFFKDDSLAKMFIENFKYLIEQAKPLL